MVRKENGLTYELIGGGANLIDLSPLNLSFGLFGLSLALFISNLFEFLFRLLHGSVLQTLLHPLLVRCAHSGFVYATTLAALFPGHATFGATDSRLLCSEQRNLIGGGLSQVRRVCFPNDFSGFMRCLHWLLFAQRCYLHLDHFIY